VEYFFDIELMNGTRTTYPDNAPMNATLRVSVPQGETITPENIIIISPEPNEDIYTDELVITVSFPSLAAHVDKNRIHVDKNRIKLYMDKYDLTRSRYFRTFDDFLTFSSKLIPPGRHKLRLELYSRSGKLLAKAEWYFTASFSFGTNLYLSNQDKPTTQPVNRYTAYGQYTFWNDRYIRLTLGDSYPEYGPLSVQNIFVRGVYGKVFLKFLNLEVAKGYIQRGINTYTQVVPDTNVVDTINGTYQRKGFSFIKSGDDTTSITSEPGHIVNNGQPIRQYYSYAGISICPSV